MNNFNEFGLMAEKSKHQPNQKNSLPTGKRQYRKVLTLNNRSKTASRSAPENN